MTSTRQLFDQFVKLRIEDKRSLKDISEILNIPYEEIISLDFAMEEERFNEDFIHAEDILIKEKASLIDQFKHMVKLYKRLTAELDKRDFSGLPTAQLIRATEDIRKHMDDLYSYLKDVEDQMADPEDFYDDDLYPDEEPDDEPKPDNTLPFKE
jgi:hypothetical protein